MQYFLFPLSSGLWELPAVKVWERITRTIALYQMKGVKITMMIMVVVGFSGTLLPWIHWQAMRKLRYSSIKLKHTHTHTHTHTHSHSTTSTTLPFHFYSCNTLPCQVPKIQVLQFSMLWNFIVVVVFILPPLYLAKGRCLIRPLLHKTCEFDVTSHILMPNFSKTWERNLFQTPVIMNHGLLYDISPYYYRRYFSVFRRIYHYLDYVKLILSNV